MELLDSSMSDVADICYRKLGKPVPEDILGKMSVEVSGRRDVVSICPNGILLAFTMKIGVNLNCRY